MDLAGILGSRLISWIQMAVAKARDLVLQGSFGGLVGVVLLSLGVRLLGIATRPIWYDEAFSILFAEKGPAKMLIATQAPLGIAASDVHPLGYYLILWAWMRSFGESLLSVRGLSVLAGAITVVPIYLLARDLLGSRVALGAGIVFGLAPFQVHYGQEIRMYAFLCLWLMLATYFFLRGRRSYGWGWWVGFAVCAALAGFTQYLALFYLAPLAVWPCLQRDWRTVRNVALSTILSMLISLPWLLQVPAQFAAVSKVYWIAQPPPYRLLTLLLTFVTNLPLPGWLLPVGLFLTLTLVAAVVLQIWKSFRTGDGDWGGIAWLGYLTIVPPLALFAFSQWRPLYLERALLPSGAVACILIGWAMAKTDIPSPTRVLTVAIVLAAFSIGLYEHVADTGFPYARFAEMAQALQAQRGPMDAVVH